MDNKTVFVRTDKGEDEVRGRTAQLSGDIKRALLMVDGDATFGEISKRAAPSLRDLLDEMFKELEKGGFIQDDARISKIPRMVMPTRMVTPIKSPVNENLEELDFTGIFHAPSPEAMAVEAARAQAEKTRMEAETRARAEAEIEARQEVESTKLKAQQTAEAAHLKDEHQAAKDHAVAETKARLKAEYETTHKRAEVESRAKHEAETARVKAEQAIAQARAELEAKKAKVEIEARARGEAERRAREEAARLKAQQDAEAARLKAERDAAKAREELELAKQQAAAEVRAREEIERRVRAEVEAARMKAEQEAAQVRAELEAAKAKAEAEAQARAEAEKVARQEAEFARVEVARLKAEAEAKEIAEAARLKAEQEATKAREEAEQRAREEAEAARVKAQQEAEAARLKAERGAAKAREESERHAKEAAEAARLKAEQEAAQARAELEAARARAKAEAEERARHEAELARAEAEVEARRAAEAARLRLEQEAARAREEFEFARQKAEAETIARKELERHARDEVQRRAQEEAEAVGMKAEQEAEAILLQSARNVVEAVAEAVKTKPGAGSPARSSSATVLFFDVVGYTRQPVNKQTKIKKQFNRLLADCLMAQGDVEHIILDTGDGAAIGFLQHPEDALEVAIQFRKIVMSNQHKDYPDLKVRVGIHLGPINVVKDVNGQSNMVGDGINDAQRVMSFSDADQIYISRSYYDFISRLSDEYAELFQYRGSLKDKHGREHPVYELVDTPVPAAKIVLPHTDEAAEIKLEPFSFVIPEEEAVQTRAMGQEIYETEQSAALIESVAVKHDQAGQVNVIAEEEQATQPQLPLATPPEAAKPPSKAHMPSEEDVAKLAEEQTKAWADAERRAIETTKANAERAAQQLSEDRRQKIEGRKSALKPKFPAIISRLPWGKVSAGLFVVLLITLFVGPYILPTQGYASRIEQLLAARLQQPVHIGRLSGRLLPSPRLELGDVSIGGAKQIQAGQVQVNFTLPALFASVKPISSVNLEGMQINGAALPQVSVWLQKIAADTDYPIARIELNQSKLEANGIQLSGIGGELNFNQAGRFVQAKLRAEGSKFALDINAVSENKMQISFTARGSALPLLPNWAFDELNAKGELSGNELVITDFDSHILGGVLLGNARINWRSGWRADGNLVAKVITLQNLSKALGGDMDGSAQFRMEAASLDKLTDAAIMNGTFVIKKGLINGIDIIETARLRGRDNSPGGRTHFDELSGELSAVDGTYAFRQLRMNAGVLKATGTLDVVKQQLSGHLSADLTMRAGAGSIDLQVSGTTGSPSLRTAR